MSLKCSIFGHKYAAPDVERERDEQGSEVVITIRELETCVRCDETRVVSENKEVTTLETPDLGEETTDAAAGTEDYAATGAAADATDVADAGAEGAVEGSARSDHVEEATDAEIIDGDSGSESGPESGSGAAPTAGSDTDSGGAPSTSPAASPGAAGERAGAADVAADEAGGEDEEDAAPAEDDGVILEGGDGSDVASERQPGEWPEESDEETEPDWVAETEPAAPTGDEDSPEIESAASAMSVPDGEFYCTECGFTANIEASSLRDGDFCPECHQGTLETRPAED